MGQFIAVSAANAPQASHTLAHCVEMAQALFGQPVRTQQVFGNTAVATFARRSCDDESGRLRVFDEVQAWCLGVGTWVHHNGLSAEQQSRHLADCHQQRGKTQAQLADIDGSYCFVTGSTRGDSLNVITDPIGQLHVYRAELTDAVLISTSALLLAQVVDAGWNPLAVREFLARGTIYEERSLFHNVRKFGPATIVSYASGTRQVQASYWSVREQLDSPLARKKSLRSFAAAIQTSMARTVAQFARPALDLTGGFDSRILLCAARQVNADDTLHTVVTGPPDSPDAIAAAQIGQHLALAHERLDNTPESVAAWWQLAQSSLPLVDGECNILEYANILFVHQQLAERFGISINGSGGELIRGYWWELLFPRIGAKRHFDARHVAARRFAVDSWAESILAFDHKESLIDHFAGVIQRANTDLKACRNTACMDNVYLRLRMQRWQGRIASATNQIWPCLSPLLFRKPMEIALGAPVSLRLNGGMARHLLAQMDLELARLPMAGGYPALPITLATLPQFWPLGREYLLRIRNRVRRTTAAPSRTPARQDTRMQALAQLGEVANVLDPARMLTAELYETPPLQDMTHAMAKGYGATAHSGRVMTLEAVARLRQRLPRNKT